MHAEKMSANWDQLMSPPSLNIMDEKVHMYLKTCIFLVEQRPHTCNPTASVVNFWCCHEKVETLGGTYLADSIPSVVAILDWEEDTASWYLISVCSTV